MEKTKAALDDLFSSTIVLIPTWLSMLRSTRFLTVLIIIAVLVWAWKYSGLTETEAQIVSIVGGLLGANFSWVKTIGKKYETHNTASSSADAIPRTDAAAQPAQPDPIAANYDEPLDIEAYTKSTGGDVREQYDASRRIIANYNLLKIHPSVRVTVAGQVVDKAISLAKACWPAAVGVGANGAYHRPPEQQDFKDYASRQEFDRAVREAIPGCQYMPEGASVLVRDFAMLYRYRSNLTLLEGKPVRWYEPDGITPRIACIDTLANMGLSAVA